MSKSECLVQRLLIVEEVLRRMASVTMQLMPPDAADIFNEIGLGWNQALDKLDAEYAPKPNGGNDA